MDEMTPAVRIVDVLEAAGEPLDRRTIRERTGLDRDQFETVLGQLRGRQVVRKLGETDAFRLTYWPDSEQCVFCDGD